jgi:dUTP pyrophosphatase
MNVKVKKLVEEAIIPSYAKKGDAGLDLTAVSYEYDKDKDCHIYGTGLAFEIPEGHVGLLFPRSSNRKTDAYLCNHVGVVDSGYRGEVMFSFKNRDKGDEIPQLVKPYNVGDRVGQLIILPFPEINLVESDELSETERGTGGHGHTGA